MDTKIARWSCFVIWPALKRLVLSGMEDFSLLYRAGKHLAKQSHGFWASLISECREFATSAKKMNRSNEAIFPRLLKILNEKMFLENDILLSRCPDRIMLRKYPEDPWANVRVSVGSIVNRFDVHFTDITVPCFLVTTTFPIPFLEWESTTLFDPMMGWVVLDRNRCETDLGWAKIFAKQGSVELAPYLQQGANPSQIEILRKFYHVVRHRHSNADFFRRFSFIHDLCHETRHAVDGLRLRHFLGEDWPTPDDGRLFADTLLFPGGWLSKQIERREEQESIELMKVSLINSLSELTAQLTAAAISVDPNYVIWEWWCDLSSLSNDTTGAGWKPLYEFSQHTVAETAAVLLLAEQLDLGTISREALVNPDFRELADLAQQIAQCRPEELRLALKAIYRREFMHPIDESPYPGIDENGSLVWRTSEQELSYREGDMTDIKSQPDNEDNEVIAQRFTIRKGIHGKMSIDVTSRLAGSRIIECSYARGRLMGKIAVSGRSLRFPEICCILLSKKGRLVDVVPLDVSDLNPGEIGPFQIHSNRLLKARRLVLDIKRI